MEIMKVVGEHLAYFKFYGVLDDNVRATEKLTNLFYSDMKKHEILEYCKIPMNIVGFIQDDNYGLCVILQYDKEIDDIGIVKFVIPVRAVSFLYNGRH